MRASWFVSHALAGRLEISIRFIFFIFLLSVVRVKNLQPWPWVSLSASSVLQLHECVLKPQSQQSSLILRLWRTLYLAFLGLDATRLVQEA